MSNYMWQLSLMAETMMSGIRRLTTAVDEPAVRTETAQQMAGEPSDAPLVTCMDSRGTSGPVDGGMMTFYSLWHHPYVESAIFLELGNHLSSASVVRGFEWPHEFNAFAV
jgi:hypothetical protein